MPKARRHARPLSTAVALFATVVSGLAACGEPADLSSTPASSDVAVATEALVPAQTTTAFRPSRETALVLADVQGHVEAAAYLHAAGAPGAVAAGHLTRALQHHIQEHQARFRQLGLDRDLVAQVARSLGESSGEVASELATLQAHFRVLVDIAQGDPLVQIRHLVDRSATLYAAAVEGEVVVAPDAYFEALGHATVAFDRASSIKGDAGDALRNALNDLLNLWPRGAALSDAPATAETLRDQINRVRDILRYTR